MRPLQQILDNINACIDRYETCKLSLSSDQSEILRTLSTNLYWLTQHRVHYHGEWMKVYFETAGTNAAKEKEADREVKELYQIRHFMASGQKVLESIRSTLSESKRNT